MENVYTMNRTLWIDFFAKVFVRVRQELAISACRVGFLFAAARICGAYSGLFCRHRRGGI